MKSDPRQLDLGLEAKVNGIALVTQNNPDWVAQAQDIILGILRSRSEVTADDLRQVAGPPPNVNCAGAAFNGLARGKLIRRIGFRPAEAPTAHARFISVWALNDYQVPGR